MNTENLKFDAQGLIPAIVQDAATGEVLTLAYMNKESLEITLQEVVKNGPACHTGAESCFFQTVQEAAADPFTYGGLYKLLEGRKAAPQEGSYTSYLFEKGLDKILKKVGEESTEVIIAGKGGDCRETVYEIADLAYHVMVLMVEMGLTMEDVRTELASRHIIDHKVKQEKMTN